MPTELSPARKRLFVALTMLFPLILLGALEGVLRLAWRGGSFPAFDALTLGQQHLLVPSLRVSRRYFTHEAMPPAPPTDVFAANKPARAFRIFVLGESSAAGFPYPHNGTFSRVLRDALRDALPSDSVEVVNVGIAATNSFTIDNLSSDILGQQPDAVLIYAGHNEYYGALGVGSSIRFGSSPRLTRAYLSAQRLRTVVLLRVALNRMMRGIHGPSLVDSTAVSFMESIARDQQIELGSASYHAGLAQFHDNMGRALRRFRAAGVPVFIASIASNEREQRPFVSEANAPARAAFDSAERSLARGDSAGARRLFVRARDLDVIRFRAPSALNDTIRALASASGAYYVPVAERFSAEAPGGMPGRELFLEHVHPNQHAAALIAAEFFEALRTHVFFGREAHVERLLPWTEYEHRMAISSFDEKIVQITVQSLTTRWPFVARADAVDVRGTYTPVDLEDSLALLVARGGIPWAIAKLRVAEDAEKRGDQGVALEEYRGLLRDRPFIEAPYRSIGRVLVALGRGREAVPFLERAVALSPQPESAYLLGVIALEDKDYPRAITWLDRAVTQAPGSVAPLYQLSLAFGLSRNIAAARGAAANAARIDPRYPGLADWMKVLGMARP